MFDMLHDVCTFGGDSVHSGSALPAVRMQSNTCSCESVMGSVLAGARQGQRRSYVASAHSQISTSRSQPFAGHAWVQLGEKNEHAGTLHANTS